MKRNLSIIRLDTHWNKLGGFIGAQALIAAAGELLQITMIWLFLMKMGSGGTWEIWGIRP